MLTVFGPQLKEAQAGWEAENNAWCNATWLTNGEVGFSTGGGGGSIEPPKTGWGRGLGKGLN